MQSVVCNNKSFTTLLIESVTDDRLISISTMMHIFRKDLLYHSRATSNYFRSTTVGFESEKK